jgi:phospholipid transport system transporter-binding protein
MVLNDQELSLRNASTVSQAGLLAIQNGSTDINMAALKNVDSSAVAVMLEWQRQAQALNRGLQFSAVPASVMSLIALYGLNDFFHITNPASPERH